MSQRLADGNTNSFSYDELNRLTQINYFDNKVVTYTYGLDSKRQAVKGELGITTYSYDGQGRLKQITQPSASNSLTVTYNYYPGGQRASMTNKAGTINYTYDAANQLATVTDPQNGVSSYDYYDVTGLRKRLTLPNGIKTDYNYDELNRLTSLVQYVTMPQTPLASYTYSLDAANRRTKVVQVDNTSIEWGYDDASRLTSETWKNSGGTVLTNTTYTYDKVGNRKTLVQTVGGNPTTTTYNYNQLDQITSTSTGGNSTSYTYDGRGNLTQVGANTTYSYNAADRLVGMTVAGGSATYTYDADGRRVKQVSGGNTANYLWDEESQYGDVVAETDGSGNVQTSYVLGGSELLSQKKGATTNYFLKDGQGNIRALTNGSGTISESYSFDAFGKLQSGPAIPNTAYLYTGQQFDVLSGLYSLRARYYNPGDGRFLSRDRAAYFFSNPIELNRYNYTHNDPLNNDDPSGYFTGTLNQTPTPPSTAPTTQNSNSGGGNEYATLVALVTLVAVSSGIVVGLGTDCLYERLISIAMANAHNGAGLLALEATSILHCHIPIMKFSVAVWPHIAQHIQDAQDAGWPMLLTARRNENERRQMRNLSCWNWPRPRPAPPHESCDEYPFASSFENIGNAHIRGVPDAEQSAQGGYIAGFLTLHRVQRGDYFAVVVT